LSKLPSYIIEHPTRGTYNGEETDGGNPSFSWSGMRDDPEKAHRFYDINTARDTLSGWPDAFKDACQILRAPGFEVAWP
jgi:hypothetical protein